MKIAMTTEAYLEPFTDLYIIRVLKYFPSVQVHSKTKANLKKSWVIHIISNFSVTLKITMHEDTPKLGKLQKKIRGHSYLKIFRHIKDNSAQRYSLAVITYT